MTFAATPLFAQAGSPPAIYDEAADAKAAIRASLAEAAPAKLPVLVVFGANWCEDCRALDQAIDDEVVEAAREHRDAEPSGDEVALDQHGAGFDQARPIAKSQHTSIGDQHGILPFAGKRRAAS